MNPRRTTLAVSACFIILCASCKTGEEEETSSGGAGGMAASGGKAATAGKGGASAGTSGGGSGGEMAGGAAGTRVLEHYVYVSGAAVEITGFKFDIETGALTAGPGQAMGAELYNPTYLAYHPDGKALYASDELGFNVSSLSIEAGTGKLKSLADKDAGGSGNVHVSVHPSGRWVFSSNYGGANIKVFPVLDSGAIGDPVETQPTGAESHQVMASRDGTFVFVPCRGPNHIVQFKFDVETGKLTANNPKTVMSDDPRHLAFHPNGKYAYLVNEKPDGGAPANVVAFALDGEGKLAPLNKLDLAPTEKWGAHVEVTPDGKYLYASGRDTETMYIFSVGMADGKLTAAGKFDGKDLFDHPRDFTVDPMGNHLLVASGTKSQVVVLKINKADGTLARVGEPMKVAAASTVVVVPVPKP